MFSEKCIHTINKRVYKRQKKVVEGVYNNKQRLLLLLFLLILFVLLVYRDVLPLDVLPCFY